MLRRSRRFFLVCFAAAIFAALISCNGTPKQKEGPQVKNLTPPTVEKIEAAVRKSVKEMKSQRFVKKNIEKIIPSLVFANKNCLKRLPQDKCYVHGGEWGRVPVEGSNIENAIHLEADSSLMQDNNLFGIFAQCQWPVPLDAYKKEKPQSSFVHFPLSPLCCDYFPAYGKLSKQISRLHSCKPIDVRYFNTVAIHTCASDEVVTTNKHLYTLEIEIFNYPNYKTFFEVYFVE